MNTQAWIIYLSSIVLASLAGYMVGYWRGWGVGTDEQLAEQGRKRKR